MPGPWDCSIEVLLRYTSFWPKQTFFGGWVSLKCRNATVLVSCTLTVVYIPLTRPQVFAYRIALEIRLLKNPILGEVWSSLLLIVLRTSGKKYGAHTSTVTFVVARSNEMYHPHVFLSRLVLAVHRQGALLFFLCPTFAREETIPGCGSVYTTCRVKNFAVRKIFRTADRVLLFYYFTHVPSLACSFCFACARDSVLFFWPRYFSHSTYVFGICAVTTE